MVNVLTLDQSFLNMCDFQTASTDLDKASVAARDLTKIPAEGSGCRWGPTMNRDQGYQLPPPPIYNQILPPVYGSSHMPPPMRDQDL